MDKLLVLQSALSKGKLSHALLIESANGSQAYFESFFKSFLCVKGKPEPCGTCDSCRSNLNFNGEDNRQHPDFWFTKPEGDAGYIVDQIRDWGSKFLNLSKNLSPRKLLVVSEAEKLSGAQNGAANALLKILEEPRPDTYIILLTSKPYKMLATIRSRCLKLSFKKETSIASRISAESPAFSEFLGLFTNQKSVGQKSELSNAMWWKDKQTRLRELDSIHGSLWEQLKVSLPDLNDSEAMILWNRWKHFEDFIGAVKLYGNPPLHWLNFKRKVKGETPWHTSKLFG